MAVVLCDALDLPALWAARGLERRGLPVEVITGALLSCALEWEHTLHDDGSSASVRLADGRRLSNSEPVPILNRLSFVPRERFDAVGGADGDYARGELQALLLSWLHSMPGPVVNRASPRGLCGAWRHPSEWAVLAAQAGLAALPYRQTCSDAPDAAIMPAPPAAAVAFVAGERVVPSPAALPADLLDGCRRLARLAGETLIGVDLVPNGGGWAVAGASVTPDLSRGGEVLLDALQELLAA